MLSCGFRVMNMINSIIDKYVDLLSEKKELDSSNYVIDNANNKKNIFLNYLIKVTKKSYYYNLSLMTKKEIDEATLYVNVKIFETCKLITELEHFKITNDSNNSNFAINIINKEIYKKIVNLKYKLYFYKGINNELTSRIKVNKFLTK